jgi:CheY-like chemotaxis protein
MNIANNDTTASNIVDPGGETLAQRERLLAIGRSASGIADEIDNAIAPIALYTEALLARETLSDRSRHYLASIRGAADEVASSVRRLRETQHIETRRHPAPLATPRSLRVLLIDDDPSLIEALRSSLIDEGHKVSAASGGQAGIDTFRAACSAGMPFDIVITDLAMPDVDGRQVVASLRAVSPATPIILLTGWGQHVANGSERLPQVDRLLGKPPRIRELRCALAELTERRVPNRLG